MPQPAQSYLLGLPQESLHYIVMQLSSSRDVGETYRVSSGDHKSGEALKSVLLTCKQLCVTTRPILWHTLCLQSDKWVQSRGLIKTFFLAPKLANLVKRLFLDDNGLSPNGTNNLEFRLYLAALALDLDKLEYEHDCTAFYHRRSSRSLIEFYFLIRVCQNLETLQIHVLQDRPYNVHQLLEQLLTDTTCRRHLRKLKSLSLWACRLSTRQLYNCLQLPCLRSLSMNYVDDQLQLKFLPNEGRSLFRSKVRSLELTWHGSRLDTLHSLLAFCPDLHTFRIKFDRLPTPSVPGRLESGKLKSLKMLANLQVLSILWLVLFPPSVETASSDPEYLVRLLPRSLKDLHLKGKFEDSEETSMLAGMEKGFEIQILALMASEKFTQLERVEFEGELRNFVHWITILEGWTKYRDFHNPNRLIFERTV